MKNKGLSYFLRLQVAFLWLLCMVLCSQLHAQEHLTRNMLMLSNLNTDNGLSSARVYSIVEAEDGAMWISTKRGVDRYNGQQVRNYTLATDMQFSDASGRNIKLTKDSQQHIYAYDNKGKIYISSNPQPIGFRGNLLVKRPKFFYCTYSLGITETS